MNILAGCTGFVGSNLYEKGNFEGAYHSTDIQDAYGTSPELLVYAGLRAEKYLANHAPEKDREQILAAQENIRKIHPKKLVLISTIDVFQNPVGVDETTPVDPMGLLPYGSHRLQLEQWVRSHYPDALIIRLPGLFGKNIRKNFIYDFIHVIPSMLKEEKFRELSEKEPGLKEYYVLQENGFYKAEVPEEKKEALKGIFRELGFSALNFTDSRSRYQFYNLAHLWEDMNTALEAGLTLWHPATEPVGAGELYRYLTGKDFVNELGGKPADYDYRTVHASLFGGRDGYLCGKETVMEEIRRFVGQ